MAADVLHNDLLDLRGQDMRALQESLGCEIWTLSPTLRPRYQAEYLDLYFDLANGLKLRGVNPETHHDVVNLVSYLKRSKSLSRGQLVQDLVTRQPLPWLRDAQTDPSIAGEALDYAVSLWLLLGPKEWQPEQSLEAFVRKLFPITNGDPSDTRLSFNSYSLKKIGGLDIVPTSRLDEHLFLDIDLKELRVFCHGSHLAKPMGDIALEVYPPGLLEETAMTLRLLYPPSESRHHLFHRRARWNRRQRKRRDWDVELAHLRPKQYSLDAYQYWHARLEAVQRHFDSTTPTRLSQWAHDRRKGDSFYAFWLAVAAICLTLLFGLVQSVTGILQVVHS